MLTEEQREHIIKKIRNDCSCPSQILFGEGAPVNSPDLHNNSLYYNELNEETYSSFEGVWTLDVVPSGGSSGSGSGFRYIGPIEPDTTDWVVNDLWYDTSTEV